MYIYIYEVHHLLDCDGFPIKALLELPELSLRLH